MATISTLLVNLKANTAAFVKKIKDSRKKLFKFSKGAKKALAAIGRAFKSMSVVAVAALTAVAYKVNQAFGDIDRIAKMSSQLGVSTEFLAGMEHAAKLTGESIEGVYDSIKEMNKKLGELNAKGGEAKDMLESMGLSVSSLVKMGPEKAYLKLADAISKVEDVSKKAYVANAIFSESGIKMLNMFNQGASGLAAMRAEADQLGLTFNNIQASQIEAANDAVTRAKSAFQGFTNVLAIELAPIVAVIADQLTAYTTGIDRATISTSGFVEGMITTARVFSIVGNVVSIILNVIKAAVSFLATFVFGLEGIILKIVGLLKYIPGLKSVGEYISESGDFALEFGRKMKESVVNSVGSIIDSGKSIGEAFSEDFGKGFASNVMQKRINMQAAIEKNAKDNAQALSKARLESLAAGINAGSKPGTTVNDIGMKQGKAGGALEYRSENISFSGGRLSQYAKLLAEQRKNTTANQQTSQGVRLIANKLDAIALG